MDQSTPPRRKAEPRHPDFARNLNWWGLMMIGLGMAVLAYAGLSFAQS